MEVFYPDFYQPRPGAQLPQLELLLDQVATERASSVDNILVIIKNDLTRA